VKCVYCSVVAVLVEASGYSVDIMPITVCTCAILTTFLNSTWLFCTYVHDIVCLDIHSIKVSDSLLFVSVLQQGRSRLVFFNRMLEKVEQIDVHDSVRFNWRHD
jgi:hypothetical protein